MTHDNGNDGNDGDDDMDYEVGYKKPPKHTRFKKGDPSPNPNGRPKGAQNAKTFLNTLSENYTKLHHVHGSGKKEALAAFDIALKQQINLAMKGDKQSFKLVTQFYERNILPILKAKMREEECAYSAAEISKMSPIEAARIYQQVIRSTYEEDNY